MMLEFVAGPGDCQKQPPPERVVPCPVLAGRLAAAGRP
jgi:hypothetical protein